MMLRHSKELKLTEEQIDKLETLASDTRMKLIDLRAEVAKGELEIANLIRSGSDDMARIKSHLDAVSSARSKIAELRITNLFEARKVLTPEQKKQVKDEFPRLRPMLD
jgi:Spy/CpxP family protein refolding chaperone